MKELIAAMGACTRNIEGAIRTLGERITILSQEIRSKNEIEQRKLDYNEQKEQAYAILRDRMKGKQQEVRVENLQMELLRQLTEKITRLEKMLEDGKNVKGPSDPSTGS